ncbi:MAG: hypothetical protein HFI22_04785 [Lachnospiraceae bacterium]|nr:hypothetical protein [Lachnospiraceae bacterium]
MRRLRGIKFRGTEHPQQQKACGFSISVFVNSRTPDIGKPTGLLLLRMLLAFGGGGEVWR